MTTLEGQRTLEIDAPIERVFAIAADVERAPQWQGTMKTAQAREHDAEGRPVLVDTEIDASVATVKLLLRFTYDRPTGMRWSRESGDLNGLEGSWVFEDLGDGRTRATYALEIGLGRKLGLLSKTVQGPVRSKVEDLLAMRPVEGLKKRAEGGA